MGNGPLLFLHTTYMDKQTIERKLFSALTTLYKKDIHLLKENLNERSITHKLAVYLQRQFRGYDVDCEYNGNVESAASGYRKTIPDELCPRLKEYKRRSPDETKDLSVFPDIIIHKRGENRKNLLIIEVKKALDHPLRAQDLGREFDCYKLCQYTNRQNVNTSFLYELGCFIEIGTGRNRNYSRLPLLVWFANGIPQLSS